MTVTFECVEPAWLDEVQIIGDLEDCSWVGGDNSLRLTHQGNGIYTGTIRFVAPESHPDYSSFRIVAGYANMTEGNYRSATAWTSVTATTAKETGPWNPASGS